MFQNKIFELRLRIKLRIWLGSNAQLEREREPMLLDEVVGRQGNQLKEEEEKESKLI